MTPAAMDALRAVVAEMRAAAKRTYGLSQLTAWADRLDALATPPTSDALTKAVEAAPLMLRQFARWLRDESVPVSECYKPDEIEAAAASIAAVRALGVRGSEQAMRDWLVDNGWTPPAVVAAGAPLFSEQRGVDEAIPEEAFDSYAVYKALSKQATQRTGPENVADTLDALVLLIRKRMFVTAALKEQAHDR